MTQPKRKVPAACDLALSPRVGGTCLGCGRTVFPFDGVTPEIEAQLIAHIRSGHTVSAISLLRTVSGRGLEESKWMIEHMLSAAGIPRLDPSS